MEPAQQERRSPAYLLPSSNNVRLPIRHGYSLPVNGIRHWLQHTGITVFFWAAVAILVILVICSYTQTSTVPTPGEQQTTPLPWLADLCMAYIGAYFFHYLVVVLPGRSKLESRLKTLQIPLTTIAFNGFDMIRELELIAKCPARGVSEEHLDKVLGQLEYSTAIRSHLSKRMEDSREAYRTIVPYAADLPLDLQEALQNESQSLAHDAFSLEPSERIKWPYLRILREKQGLSLPLTPLVPYVLRYYQDTEAVRLLLEKYLPSTREYLPEERTLERGKKPKVRAGRRVNMFDLHLEPEYPYWDYPEPETEEARRLGDARRARDAQAHVELEAAIKDSE